MIGLEKRAASVMLALALFTVGPAGGAVLTDEAPAAVWIERQKITPDDADEPGVVNNSAHWGVRFGSDVVIDGDTAAVGTQPDSNSDWGGPGDGFDWAYVFERGQDGVWRQTAKLLPSEAVAGDTFAYQLGLDAETGVIAAGNPAGGKVHIFERGLGLDEGWMETMVIEKDDEYMGMEVTVQGHTVAIGTGDGVWIYEKDRDGWEMTSRLADAVNPFDLEGDTLVSQSRENFPDFTVYRYDDDSWQPRHELPTPRVPDSLTPGSIDLREEGDAIVFGASNDDNIYGLETGTGFRMPVVGSAWVYELIDGAWTMTEEIPNPDPHTWDRFGQSVGISGERIVISAPGDIHNGGDQSGAVYVHEDTPDGWTMVSKLRNSDGGPYGGIDWFGETVDVDQGTIIVGAPWDDNRRDGTPPPLDDNADRPPCLSWAGIPYDGCDEGQYAGSVYIFEQLTEALDA